MQRIKKPDWHLKFLVEKLAHVRHARAATTKKNASRLISLVLRAVMRDGPHQFCVQAGHGAARDFRNARYVWVARFGVSAAQTDEPVAFLTRAGRLVAAVEGRAPSAWFFDPADVDYLHGHGQSEAGLAAVLGALLAEGGEAALGLADKPALAARLVALARGAPCTC